MSNNKSVSKRSLTTREQAILDCIKNKIRENGFPPTVREICNEVGLRSTSTVHGYLARLEELGVIKRDPSSSRAIEVTEDMSWRKKKIVPTPIVGSVRAGEPVLADERIETVLPLPAELIGNQVSFILTVRGDSMINAGIHEGDLLIVAQQNTAINGDIVVALVDGEDATVKRFYKEADHVRLQPENDAYEPILTKNVQILGKVVGLYRHYN
ncbi:MAG: transcriptional repressor LexA [Allisonella histaminiformans]|uniref:transcriptional repressor LexA n=2 Tax=Allisonella histaminiformans TaxID=209880 RepID=UPI0026704B0B|nr:transcriptional repressor LexA [Allisonella histaminiformans]MDY3957122.1 transcriptional repressor LexA [Allisonella histaminiformans]